jgi:hypothetical protein
MQQQPPGRTSCAGSGSQIACNSLTPGAGAGARHCQTARLAEPKRPILLLGQQQNAPSSANAIVRTSQRLSPDTARGPSPERWQARPRLRGECDRQPGLPPAHECSQVSSVGNRLLEYAYTGHGTPCGPRERWGCHVLTSQGRGVERRRDPGVHGESLPFACGGCALSVSRFRGAGDEQCQLPSVGRPRRALASACAASARASRASRSGARVGCPSRHATRRARRPLSRLAKPEAVVLGERRITGETDRRQRRLGGHGCFTETNWRSAGTPGA